MKTNCESCGRPIEVDASDRNITADDCISRTLLYYFCPKCYRKGTPASNVPATSFQVREQCFSCGGSGRIKGYACQSCGGNGETKREVPLLQRPSRAVKGKIL